MCIALLTTAHPDYALIVLDNRDEFILRPTSRPHWWSPEPEPTPAKASAAADGRPQILSARDLQREEHGTWLGITRSGHFAVLTNFREYPSTPGSVAHPVHGQRSRGGMVTAWLAADETESTEHFVERLLEGPGVGGVGGFSLICGKLRLRKAATGAIDTTKAAGAGIAPLAIVSNRADHPDQVPWIAGRRGEVYGLSNASYDDPEIWPKVKDGKEALAALASENARQQMPKEALRDALFAILDQESSVLCRDRSLEEQIPLLKHSIFVPPIGNAASHAAMDEATAAGPRACLCTAEAIDSATTLTEEKQQQQQSDAEAPQTNGFMTGLYGTQRQTIVLVDWDGNVSFTERALWDANGNPIPRGQGDVHFNFHIDGWEDEAPEQTGLSVRKVANGFNGVNGTAVYTEAQA